MSCQQAIKETKPCDLFANGQPIKLLMSTHTPMLSQKQNAFKPHHTKKTQTQHCHFLCTTSRVFLSFLFHSFIVSFLLWWFCSMLLPPLCFYFSLAFFVAAPFSFSLSCGFNLWSPWVVITRTESSNQTSIPTHKHTGSLVQHQSNIFKCKGSRRIFCTQKRSPKVNHNNNNNNNNKQQHTMQRRTRILIVLAQTRKQGKKLLKNKRTQEDTLPHRKSHMLQTPPHAPIIIPTSKNAISTN